LIAKYLRIPFVQDGRDWKGCDCYGLIYLIYKTELDITIASFSGAYSTREEMLERHSLDEWQKVGEPKMYDVVLFSEAAVPKHIGMVLDNKTMIHTCRARKFPMVEKYTNFIWKPRIEGFYRCKHLLEQ
jgi:cell wall-associated NlpC family hydrolase